MLNVLNGFITAHISGNCSEKAYDELERLMSDRNSFIESTRMSYDAIKLLIMNKNR